MKLTSIKGSLALAAISILVLAPACAESGSGGASELSSPCDVADAELVGASFGGTVSPGVEGGARNCSFDIEGGEVLAVSVFYFGTDDAWGGTRSGFEENRGGTTDVSGIGDEAFYPNDTGPRELVARAGGHIFAVTVFTALADPSPTAVQSVADLSKAIAATLG